MTHRVLVADDSSTIQKVIKIAFARHRLEFVEAGTLGEALAAAKPSAPDLVIVDATLPGTQVPGDFKKLQADVGGAPLILLIGSYDAVDEAALRAVGIENILKKPFESGDLVKCVETLLNLPPPARTPVPPAPLPGGKHPAMVVPGGLSAIPQEHLPPPPPMPSERGSLAEGPEMSALRAPNTSHSHLPPPPSLDFGARVSPPPPPMGQGVRASMPDAPGARASGSIPPFRSEAPASFSGSFSPPPLATDAALVVEPSLDIFRDDPPPTYPGVKDMASKQGGRTNPNLPPTPLSATGEFARQSPFADVAPPAALPGLPHDAFLSAAPDLGGGYGSSQPPSQGAFASPPPPPPFFDGSRRAQKAFDPADLAFSAPGSPESLAGLAGASTSVNALVLEDLSRDLPELVRRVVEDYCDRHFKSLAREFIASELRRLADEKARHLVDN